MSSVYKGKNDYYGLTVGITKEQKPPGQYRMSGKKMNIQYWFWTNMLCKRIIEQVFLSIMSGQNTMYSGRDRDQPLFYFPFINISIKCTD